MIKIKDIIFKDETYNLYESEITEDIILFIKKVFKKNYDADVNYFQKKFLLLLKNGQIVSLIGYQSLSDSKVLIENYTKKPLEKTLNLLVKREKIIEIGNLSSSENGLGQYIIYLLIEHLRLKDYEWVFLTAPEKVLNLMSRFKLNFKKIVEAKISDLDETQIYNWGSYYEQKPFVIALDISKNKQILNNL